MTRNELMKKVDEMNQLYAKSSKSSIGNMAMGAKEQKDAEEIAEEIDELLAQIFKRGGY